MSLISRLWLIMTGLPDIFQKVIQLSNFWFVTSQFRLITDQLHFNVLLLSCDVLITNSKKSLGIWCLIRAYWYLEAKIVHLLFRCFLQCLNLISDRWDCIGKGIHLYVVVYWVVEGSKIGVSILKIMIGVEVLIDRIKTLLWPNHKAFYDDWLTLIHHRIICGWFIGHISWATSVEWIHKCSTYMGSGI